MATCTNCGADSNHLKGAGVCVTSKYHDLRLVQPKSYALSDIERLASEYADGLETTDCSKLSVQITLSTFLAHLKKREREVEG